MNVKFTIRQDVLDNSIDVLELGERATNCMRRSNIVTLNNLINRLNTLGDIRGCGVKVQHEVKNALFNYALCTAADVCSWIKKIEVIKE